jgi:hypothetical protein
MVNMNTREPIEDFADRGIRKLLSDPENLHEFLRSSLPEPIDADRFDYSKMEILPREALLPRWMSRERDLIFEIPYRLQGGNRKALVCILLEHQSATSPRIPLRTLIYLVVYWEMKLREWEEKSSPKGEFQLPPIASIVLYTAPIRWGSNRSIKEMLGEPQEFHAFAPEWEPIFWELGNHSVDELLTNEDALMQVLAVVRCTEEEKQEALRAFREMVQKLDPLATTAHSRWQDLINFALGWVLNKRSVTEKNDWINVCDTVKVETARKQELKQMSKTIAQAEFEEGHKEGLKEGQIEQTRGLLVKCGRRRLGEIPPAVVASLKQINDLERLDRLFDQLLDSDSAIQSWDDLLNVQ